MKQYERLAAWMRGRGPMSLRQMLDVGVADVVGMEPGSLGKAELGQLEQDLNELEQEWDDET